MVTCRRVVLSPSFYTEIERGTAATRTAASYLAPGNFSLRDLRARVPRARPFSSATDRYDGNNSARVRWSKRRATDDRGPRPPAGMCFSLFRSVSVATVRKARLGFGSRASGNVDDDDDDDDDLERAARADGIDSCRRRWPEWRTSEPKTKRRKRHLETRLRPKFDGPRVRFRRILREKLLNAFFLFFFFVLFATVDNAVRLFIQQQDTRVSYVTPDARSDNNIFCQ